MLFDVGGEGRRRQSTEKCKEMALKSRDFYMQCHTYNANDDTDEKNAKEIRLEQPRMQ